MKYYRITAIKTKQIKTTETIYTADETRLDALFKAIIEHDLGCGSIQKYKEITEEEYKQGVDLDE